jgi:diketogulonate reductase-like aldo/keto reductase
MNTPYVDLLLNHWPTSPASPTVDPLCDPKKPSYDEKGCRLSTWRAYVDIFNSGQSKAIGVANYNQSHLQEIIDAGMPLPAVNQVPFHLYNAPAQMDLLAFCKAHNIVLLSYSPLGIPDWHAMPASLPASTPLEDPVLLSITAAHAPATAAQVTLAWLWAMGVPSNPRSMNASHMTDNLAALSAVTLSADEISQLSSRPMDTCDIDPSFYGSSIKRLRERPPSLNQRLTPARALQPDTPLLLRVRPEGRLRCAPAPVAEDSTRGGAIKG